jgi:hypothetical protein
VAVEVDEARGDDEPADVDGRRAVEAVTDRCDRVAVDAHVAHPVEPPLRIDHAATGEHHLVRHSPTSSIVLCTADLALARSAVHRSGLP